MQLGQQHIRQSLQAVSQQQGGLHMAVTGIATHAARWGAVVGAGSLQLGRSGALGTAISSSKHRKQQTSASAGTGPLPLAAAGASSGKVTAQRHSPVSRSTGRDVHTQSGLGQPKT